jgi:hypothetical protein
MVATENSAQCEGFSQLVRHCGKLFFSSAQSKDYTTDEKRLVPNGDGDQKLGMIRARSL